MLDKLIYLDEKKQYPAAFTLNVMEAIQEEFGSMQKWSELLQNSAEPNIKAIKFMLEKVLHEGFDIEGKLDEAPTSNEVGRLITRLGIDVIVEKIKDLISNSVPKSNQKNAKAKQKITK